MSIECVNLSIGSPADLVCFQESIICRTQGLLRAKGMVKDREGAYLEYNDVLMPASCFKSKKKGNSNENDQERC